MVASRGQRELEPGARVGDYRVLRRLGAGASGEVFEAVDDAIERRVALKIMRPTLAAPGRARLEREAKSANRVNHPGAVEVLALGELEDGRPYLVLPLLLGHTLREELEAERALPVGEAWRITRSAALVLRAAEEAGVVHRDVKPENLFLELPARRVRVLDFGLARLAVPEGTTDSSLSGSAALGTPAYMPPEQWWNEGVDARSDQYALAATFFELVAGNPPHGRADVAKLLEAHLHGPVPPLPEVGDAGNAWLRRALAKDKERRFPSWNDAIEAGDEAFGAADGAPGSEAGSPGDLSPLEGPLPEDTEIAWGRRGVDPRAAAATALLLGLGVWETLGYAGPAGRDLRHVLHIGGWGAIGALASGSVAAALAVLPPRAPSRAALPWVVLGLTAVSGAVGTYTGWQAVLAGVSRASPEAQLGIFHEGAYEASSSRFVGFALASSAALALGLSLGARPGQRLRPAAPLRSYVTGALGFGFFALVTLPLGAASALSAAAIAGLSLAALSLDPPPLGPGRPADLVHAARALACVLAPVFAVVTGLSRVEARASDVFASGLTRADRLEGLARVSRDRAAVLATGLVAVLAVMLFALQYLRRHGVELARARRLALAGLCGLVLCVATDQALAARFLARRTELQAALAAQLGVYSRVSPPSAVWLEGAPPRRAAGMLVSNELIALNGQPVAPPQALVTPEGVSNLARDVAHAVAAHAEDRALGAPELSILIDRTTRWSVAAWTLAACRRGGASRVQLLLTRGEQPKLRALAEDAAHVVLPEDFVALDATLAERGMTFSPDDVYSDVALMLESARDKGPLVLAAP